MSTTRLSNPVAADPTTPCPDCGSLTYFVLHGPSKAGEFSVGCADCGTSFYVSQGEVDEVFPMSPPPPADWFEDDNEDWVLNLRGGW